MNLTPTIFEDGTAFYESLAKKYRKHSKGFFILAPSGVGKTYFCSHQTEPHWIDGDDLWIGSGAHPDAAWWLEGIDVINQIDQRSDVVTMEAMKQGFWIMGASNYWLKPDAIVIPDWDTHVSYIKEREMNHYDGGAKSDALDQVKSHIEVIMKWHTEHGVPRFGSVKDAVIAVTDADD